MAISQRRAASARLLLVAAAVVVTAAQQQQQQQEAKPGAAICGIDRSLIPTGLCPSCVKPPAGKVIFVVAADTDTSTNPSSYWMQQKGGAVRAAASLGGGAAVQVDWRTPPPRAASCATVIDAGALIAAAAAERPLALVVAASDAPECGKHIAPAVAAAAAAGVAVYAVDQNPALLANGALAYIGQDNVAAGRVACAALRAAGAKGAVFVDYDNGISAALNNRLVGCREAFGAPGRGGGADVQAVYVGGKQPEAAVAEIVEATRNGSRDGLLVGGGWTTGVQLLLAAAKALGKTPGQDVWLGVFDWSPAGVVDALRAGALTFTVDQQPSLQAALAVTLAYERARSGGTGPLAQNRVATGPILRLKSEVAAACDAPALPFCGACGGVARAAAAKDDANRTRGALTMATLCGLPAPAPIAGLSCRDCFARPSGRVLFAVPQPTQQPNSAVSFWNSVRGGALQAGALLGLYVDWRQPEGNLDVCAGIKLAAAAIDDALKPGARRPLAVVAAPTVNSECGADALLPAMARARQAGVPVIAINQNAELAVKARAADIYVGSNETAAGYETCAALAQAGAKAVLVLLNGDTSSGVTERVRGCQKVLGLATTVVIVTDKTGKEVSDAVARAVQQNPAIGAAFYAGGGGRLDVLSAMLVGAKAAGRTAGSAGGGAAAAAATAAPALKADASRLLLATVDWNQNGVSAARGEGALDLVVDQRSNAQGFLPMVLAQLIATSGVTRLASPYLFTGPSLVRANGGAGPQCASLPLPLCGTC